VEIISLKWLIFKVLVAEFSLKLSSQTADKRAAFTESAAGVNGGAGKYTATAEEHLAI